MKQKKTSSINRNKTSHRENAYIINTDNRTGVDWCTRNTTQLGYSLQDWCTHNTTQPGYSLQAGVLTTQTTGVFTRGLVHSQWDWCTHNRTGVLTTQHNWVFATELLHSQWDWCIHNRTGVLTEDAEVLQVNGPAHHTSPRVKGGATKTGADLQILVAIAVNGQSPRALHLSSLPAEKTHSIQWRNFAHATIIHLAIAHLQWC